MTRFDFSGKTILVTGASSGIGRQVAISISQRGGTLIVTGRNKERLDETLILLSGNNNLAIPADLTRDSEIESLVEQMPKANGMVFCAGITEPTPVRFVNEQAMRRTFAINYEAPVKICACVLAKKKIQKDASIVFFSSIATKYPYIGGALYIGSKAAIEAFTRVLALELAPRGIRCNCLSPAYVNTPMLQHTIQTVSSDFLEKHKEIQPLGLGEPSDVANTVMYLLSDEARWVSGQNIVLGGG